MPDPTDQTPSLELVSLPAIHQRILFVRERRVMLDEDLARLYGVETRRLTEQVDAIFNALRQLISPPSRPKRRIGFAPPENDT